MDAPRPSLGTGIDYGRLRDDIVSLQENLQDIRETAESDDGLIRATLGGRGELVELVVDPRVYRTPDASALAAKITSTIQQAAELVQHRLFALTRSRMPADSDPQTADSAFGPLLHRLDQKLEQSHRQ